jgi:alcohol dehydrogenase, propanol-preferring
MKTMLAAKFRAPHAPVSLEETDVPSPSDGYIVLEVKACGVCGSDLTIQKGHFPVPLGITLGHETAGISEDGKRWAAFFAKGCGHCAMCLRGWETGCEYVSKRLGINVDGGFARYVKVPTGCLVPIPEEVSFEAAAVSTDAVATSLHALVDNGKLLAGETVAIFGIGGLGVMAIQIAKVLGARVIAVSRSDAKRTLALALGADEVVTGSDDPSAVTGLKADLALQLVPNPAVDEQAVASVKQGGRVVMVGFTPDSFQASSLDIIRRQLQIIGSRGMTKANIQTALEWMAQGKIDTESLLAPPRKLTEINDVLDEFRAGKLIRAVIQP